MRKARFTPSPCISVFVVALCLLLFGPQAGARADGVSKVPGVLVVEPVPRTEGDNYVISIILFNNTNQLLTYVDSMAVEMTYEDGSTKRQASKNLKLKTPIVPDGYGRIAYRFPSKGWTGEYYSSVLHAASFEPYRRPAFDAADSGAKKGGTLWTYQKAEKVTDKKQIRLRGTLLNNTDEDIIAVQSSRLSFDHDHGKHVAYFNPVTFNSPIKAYEQGAYNCLIADGVFSNIRNVQVTELYYLSRPVSARPKPQPKPQPRQGNRPASGPDVSYRLLGTKYNNSNYCHSMKVEFLNNSTTRPLVRLDNVVITYTDGLKRSIKYNTLTPNLKPLGTKIYNFQLEPFDNSFDDLKVTFTPRFGEPVERNTSPTVIIKK